MTDKQTIIIAGATGNIGGGAAASLAKRGARVVLLGRNLKTLNNRAVSIGNILSDSGIKFNDNDIARLVIDFSDMESVKHAASEALDRFPRIDGLIFSVGTYVQNGPTILPNGHEVMFATNVIGPFLFTKLLIDRMQQSNGLVLLVINPTYKEIDWDDLESIKNHRTGIAFERTKTFNRIVAGELARRYAGKISSIAFNPTFIIDKSDPELKNRWPKGIVGLFWKLLTILIAKPPAVAGEPIANLMLEHKDRNTINGATFKLDKRVEKPDKAMNDKASGKRLWDELVKMIGVTNE